MISQNAYDAMVEEIQKLQAQVADREERIRRMNYLRDTLGSVHSMEKFVALADLSKPLKDDGDTRHPDAVANDRWMAKHKTR